MGKLQLHNQHFSVGYAIIIALVVCFLGAAGVAYANHSTISSLKSQLSNKDKIIAEKDNLIQADAAAIGFRDSIITKHESVIKDSQVTISQLQSNLDQLQTAKRTELQTVLTQQKQNPVAVPGSVSGFQGGWTITFYSLNTESTGKRPGQSGYGLTASGTRVQEGVTIACPKFIKLGTQIEIKGYGVRTCQDRGGGVVGNTLDVYIANATERSLSNLGRQPAQIRIIN